MKLTGPLLSMGASGSIGGIITMATWKGRPYARQLVTPSNPRSAGQTAFRAMFKFLAQNWAGINAYDAGNQSDWDDLAAAGNYSPFNAFMKYNQDLWSRALGPTVSPDQGAAVPTATTASGATAGVKSILLEYDNAADADNWGTIIYRKAGGAPTGLQTEVIAVVQTVSGATEFYNDLGLTTGVNYHYKFGAFGIGGELAALSADLNATPT